MEKVKNIDMKKSKASWTKIPDLRHTLIQYLVNHFGTGEARMIERKEDVRCYVGADLCLAMRTDPLAVIRGVSEFVTVIYAPAMTFVFPYAKREACRRMVVHPNLISVVAGSTIN